MRPLHVRLASLLTVVASLAGAIIAACSGGDSGKSEPTLCKLSDCGTKLDEPNGKCDDGTVSGPTGRCIQAAGACAWEVKTCGAACSAAPTKCPDGTTKTGTCSVDPSGACACTNACDCGPAECGGDPYKQETCADGSYGLSACVRKDGVCSWTLRPACPGDGGVDAADSKPPDTSVDTGDGGACTLSFGTCPTGCSAIDAIKVDSTKKCWSGTERVGCTPTADAGDTAVHYYCGVDTGTSQILAIPDFPASAFGALRSCNPGEQTIYDTAAYTSCASTDSGTDTIVASDTAFDGPYGDSAGCDFKGVIEPFFNANCAVSGCHIGTTPTGNMNLATGFAYPNTVGVASIEVPSLSRVKRFDADHSYLYLKITGGQAAGTSLMPPPATGTVLTTAQKDAVRCWITAGAPP